MIPNVEKKLGVSSVGSHGSKADNCQETGIKTLPVPSSAERPAECCDSRDLAFNGAFADLLYLFSASSQILRVVCNFWGTLTS